MPPVVTTLSFRGESLTGMSTEYFYTITRSGTCGMSKTHKGSLAAPVKRGQSSHMSQLLCAYCYRGLGGGGRTFLTAPCGHTFHDDCAATCTIGRRYLECPECGEGEEVENCGDDGKPWRTFWDSSDGPSQRAVAGGGDEGSREPPPAACWRRVARLQRQSEELESGAATSRAELERERARLSRTTAVEANLHRELASLRRTLDACHARSMRHVVTTGAAACFRALLESRGEPEVKVQLRQLQRTHGHALTTLFAVQHRVLHQLQQRYAARLEVWR